MPRTKNACLACGACCAFFRASFYWSEADDATPGGVHVELTVDLPPFYRVMKGTNSPDAPRCIALRGRIGEAACCAIYERRSSSCRDFPASYVDGVTPNERCDRARACYGLPPLRPEDWFSSDDEPEPEPLRPAA